MKNLLVLILITTGLFIACDKDDPVTLSVNCELLKNGLIALNDTLVGKEINTLCEDLEPAPGPDDDLGHRQNMHKLVDRIETQCNFNAEIGCYACIYTYPAQSHLIIEVFIEDSVYTRLLDIRTPEDEKLSFIRMH